MKTLFHAAALATISALFSAPALKAEEDHTPMAEQMEIVNDSYKAFRRTDDPAEGAALARTAQEAVLKVFPMVPEMVKNGTHPDAEAKAMAEYRAQIAQLLVVFCQVEQAFVAGDMDKVKELVRPIRDAKKQGHDAFMEED